MEDTFDVELSRHLAGQRGGLAPILEQALAHGAPAGAPTPVGSQPLSLKATAAMPMTSTPAAAPPAGKPSGLSLTRPPGRVSSDFGWRRDPVTGETRFHRGMDIAAAYGEEVPAAAAEPAAVVHPRCPCPVFTNTFGTSVGPMIGTPSADIARRPHHALAVAGS